MELISSRANKGIGLISLAKWMWIRSRSSPSATKMNDLPMLEAAGVGCAVANSTPELKEAADYVCEASYGEGVVEAIERFAQGEH